MHQPYSGADIAQRRRLELARPGAGIRGRRVQADVVDRVTHLSAGGVTLRAAHVGEQRLTAQL